MNKIITAAVILASGGLALADDQAKPSTETTSQALFETRTTYYGPLRLNTTWTETGVAATGIASSDFLHNEVSKPAAKPLFGENSASAPAEVVADEAAYGTPEPAASPRPSSTPSPSRSTYSPSGKGMYTGGGKDIMVEDALMAPAAPAIEISVDAGYQSRYYFLGFNEVLNAGNAGRQDTDVYYGGISGHWNGLGAGVKYIRGTSSFLTRFSAGTPNQVVAKYEEIVANVHYTLAVLPDGMLNVTGGYRALFQGEETFYNADRFDDFYLTLANSSFHLLRPSVTYHYVDQDSPPTNPNFTNNPGAVINDGELLIAQLDGQLDLPGMTGLPVDIVYYGQLGFDNEFHVTDGWEETWYQVGINVPIFVGPVTISPNWNYSAPLATANALGIESDHFWGVNVRFDF